MSSCRFRDLYCPVVEPFEVARHHTPQHTGLRVLAEEDRSTTAQNVVHGELCSLPANARIGIMPATDYSKWNSFDVSDDEDDEAQVTAARSRAAAARQQQQQAAGPASGQDAAELVARMTKAEKLGEEVLTERAQMVELDRRRNANREALAALRKADREAGAAQGISSGSGGSTRADGMKHWVCLGDTFLRQPHQSARQMLEEDQRRIESELETLRSSVKRKSSALCELDPSIAGGSNVHRSFLSLHGVSAGELQSLVS